MGRTFIVFIVLACSLLNTPADAQPTNQVKVVKDVKARITPTIDITHGPGECGRFEVTKRVVWELRGEGAGFLVKTGAQNKCNERNTTDSPGYGVDIVMYRDGTVIDILGSGAEGPNTPHWMTLEPSPPESWRPPFDPGDTPSPLPPLPDPTPVPDPLPDPGPAPSPQLDRIEAKIDRIGESLEEHRKVSRSLYDRALSFLKNPTTIGVVVGALMGKFVVPGGK